LRVQHKENGFGAQLILALFGDQRLLRQIERRLACRQRELGLFELGFGEWFELAATLAVHRPSFLRLTLESSWSYAGPAGGRSIRGLRFTMR